MAGMREGLRLERRKHLRRPVHLPATILTGGQVIAAVAEDISPGGAFLRCEQGGAFPRLVASVGLPNGRELNVFARVCWRRREPAGIGIRFDRFLEQPESERLLGKLPHNKGGK